MKRYKRKITDKKYIKTLDKEERLLYKRAVEQIEKTNKRLQKLEKGIDLNKGRYNPKTKRYERTGNIKIIENGKSIIKKKTNFYKVKNGSWASKKLFNRLVDYYDKKTNSIKLPSKINKQELRLINKATSNFLNSLTSTLEGIKQVENNTLDTISNIVGKKPNIDREDIETLYNFWNDEDWNDITQYIPPSDLYIILTESVSRDESNEEFLRRIEMYIDKDSLKGDSDIREKLIRVYNKLK